MNFSGCTIIKCTSRGFSHNFATCFSTGKPKDMFGTNTPSMMSMCNQSALLLLSQSMSACRLPKLADNSDGETIISLAVFCIFTLRPVDAGKLSYPCQYGGSGRDVGEG